MAACVRGRAGRPDRYEDEAAHLQRPLGVGSPDAGPHARRRPVSAGADARRRGLLQTQLQVRAGVAPRTAPKLQTQLQVRADPGMEGRAGGV